MLNAHSFLPKNCSKEDQGEKSRFNYIIAVLSTSLIAVLLVVSSEHAYSIGVYASEYHAENNVLFDAKVEERVKVMQRTSDEYFKVITQETAFSVSGMIQKEMQELNMKEIVVMSAVDWADITREKIELNQKEKIELRKKAEYEAIKEQEAIKKAEEEAVKERHAKKVAEEKAAEEKAKKEAKEKAEKEAKEKAEKEAAEKKKKAEEAAKNVIKISEEDKNVLLRIVEAEATGQAIEGKMLVANVILNRVNSNTFPNTVTKVVYQKGQFSPVSDGRYDSVSISESTKKAVERVLSGEDRSSGALYFMARDKSTEKNVRWFDNNLTWVYAYGGHEFYK